MADEEQVDRERGGATGERAGTASGMRPGGGPTATSATAVRRSRRCGKAGRPPRRGAARAAAEQVLALTGRESESVVAVERTDDGWRIEVEVVEARRIPDSADVLAIYEVETADDGELHGSTADPPVRPRTAQGGRRYDVRWRPRAEPGSATRLTGRSPRTSPTSSNACSTRAS